MGPDQLQLNHIRSVLTPVQASQTADAVVSVVVRERHDGLDVLLIQRVTRAGDRWSGDVAFPGGMLRGESPVEGARRETKEEVGLSLGEPVGALSPVRSLRPGGFRWMTIQPLVFVAPRGELVLEEREVSDAWWEPLEALLVRSQWVWRRMIGIPVLMPGYPLTEERVLWGLTWQMIRELRDRVHSVSVSHADS